MRIERKRYVVMRKNRTEVWCGLAKNFSFRPISEIKDVSVKTYDLSEEEMFETITCPHCKQFPFKSTEIQVYDVVRVVCFKTEERGRHEGGKQ